MPICISDIKDSPLKGKNIVDVYSDGSTMIAKDSDGKLYSWGNNDYGQLGDGTTTNSNIPICISDIENSELKNKKIKNVEYDGRTCYCYITVSGELYRYFYARPAE